ncbi:hypothetical protein E3N88_25932 [Mikania micrantha]|uniref:Uncharacterized protein n=1 Tax=Mikania micrantha TaxID=192012 RepID=A0A5N6N7V4_9ASTR|nr:hypothetical protein E3N88_25932 [Mikania micrantha]
MILTSSRYAIRRKKTFAVRKVIREFPAYFVHRGEAPQPFHRPFSIIFGVGEHSRSLRKHLGSIGGLEDFVYM